MSNLPANLPKTLRGHGLKVVETPGWLTRGRPASTGGFAPGGVLCHHTATSKATSVDACLNLLIVGRSDLPGPLCQLSLGRDGTVYVVAAGRANHAGVAKPSGTMAGGDGNVLYIGIEAQNAGTGEPWPKAQYDAYVLLCAVLSVEITHNSAQTVRAHKETSVTGKIDPAGPTPYESTFDMDRFRGRVAAKMKELQAPTPAVGPKRLSARDIFHVHGKSYYYEEDSLRGMRLAVAKLLGIDFDVQKTKDDVLIVAHGPRPLSDRLTGGFVDPLGEIPHDATYAELTWDEVSRLRSKDGERYRVSRADVLIPKAVKAGIKVVEPEAKTSRITTADWSALRAKISDPSKVRVKAFPKFLPSLEHAHDAGFPVIALTHKGQRRLPRSAAKWVDYFRGRKPIWVKVS